MIPSTVPTDLALMLVGRPDKPSRLENKTKTQTLRHIVSQFHGGTTDPNAFQFTRDTEEL